VSLRPVETEMVRAGPASHTLASIVDAIYRHHSVERGSGTARWGDKTPRNSYFLPEIHRVFPNARFVHVLRDGCDVVASMVVMGRYPTVEQAARRWNTSLDAVRAFEARHPGSVREVRYEDLVTEPAPTLRPLCEWLGLEYRDEMVASHETAERLGDVPARAHHRNVLSPVTTESVGRGRRDLDDPAARELQRLLGSHLEVAGYPPVASPGGGTAP
jgi:protein-tyrosine sulfotransferase